METSAGVKLARFCILAVVLVGIVVVGWRLTVNYVLKPQQAEELLHETSSTSRFTTTVAVAMDAFSGYAPLRRALEEEMARDGVRAVFDNDGADYDARIRKLADGTVQFAVFDIASFIIAQAGLGALPGTIIFIIDESKGADAVVAYKTVFDSLDDLNDPAARVVLVPHSPSDALITTTKYEMDLRRMPQDWRVEVDSADQVFERFRQGRGRKEAYVLWEPYLSMALQDSSAATLIDSSQMSGIIVDILVVNREYLRDHRSTVQQVVEAYFRTLYRLTNDQSLAAVIQEDAERFGGEKITRAQADALATGIQFKNTMENWAHFGIGPAQPGMRHIEDMCSRLVRILLETRTIDRDPTGGNSAMLFYGGVLADLHTNNFHPGSKLGVLQTGQTPEQVRADGSLEELAPEEWTQLLPVGHLRVADIEFRRASAKLTTDAEATLAGLADSLSTFPQYYVVIEGNARNVGDLEANRRLAEARAAAVREFLVGKLGVPGNRIRAVGQIPSDTGGEAQTVTFLVGQRPF